MSTRIARSFLLKIYDRLSHAATAFHLWCAEQELRLADTNRLPKELAQARSRNLDTLRAYRRRGEFPRHQQGLTGAVPCFVDDAGRQCAVACLMHQSVAGAAASQIAGCANFARIREMAFPELNAWADTSGFTQAELARIQPTYAPTPEQLERAFELYRAVWVIGSTALISIVINALRLFIMFAHRFNTCLLGLMTGVLLLGLFFLGEAPSSHYPDLRNETHWYLLAAAAIGVVAVLFAIIPIFARRNEPENVPPRLGRLGESSCLFLLTFTFLTPPLLVYFKVIGPGRESRFERVYQVGHYGVVRGVACSDTGEIITASTDGTAIVWDATSGRRLRICQRGHDQEVLCVAVSRDGRIAITGSADQTAAVWDVGRAEKKRTLRGHTFWVESVALSADGARAVTGSTDRSVILWQTATGEKLKTFSATKPIFSVALSADGLVTLEK